MPLNPTSNGVFVTASADVDALVTDDKDFIQKLESADAKCEVVNFGEFKRRLAAFS